MADDLGALADELYGLPAEEFVAARNSRAKQLRAEGHRDRAAEVAALPRPTVAAWLLNQLSRRRASAVELLVSLGAEMREAQQSLDGEQMRALARQRQQVVRAFSRQVAELGDELGRPVSGTVADQVDETLRAAVADEGAGQALLSGRLTTALSYVGMGEVSVSSAVAVPRARARPATVEQEPADEVGAARDRRHQAAVDALAQAEQAAEGAAETLASLDKVLTDLAERRSTLQERLEALRAELAEVEAEATEIDDLHEQAQARRDDAATTADAARATADRARGDLDDLR